MSEEVLRVGVDVGGTNTDGVLMSGRRVVCACKEATSEDVTAGVVGALAGLRRQAGEASWARVAAVMVGTTHFLNAVLEAPVRRQLNGCAVLRLCGSATQGAPPLCDWPPQLSASVHRRVWLLAGGHQACGRETIAELDEREVEEAAESALREGLKSFAVSAVFSTVNPEHEKRAAQVIEGVAARRGESGVRVTLSSDIGSLGLLERENAAILNAALGELAEKTVAALQRALVESGLLKASLFLVGNDGALCDAATASRFPVLTFSSGATNSARGAAFLTEASSAVVFDVGGTSTECALLVDGFPRLSQTEVYVGGVRTNFRMPAIISAALGGGSKITHSSTSTTIGPESVRYKIRRKAVSFGGHTITASDAAVAAGLCDLGLSSPQQSTRETLNSLLNFAEGKEESLSAWLKEVQNQVHDTMQRMMDAVRTCPQPLPVILVGGGSVIVDASLPFDGATQVIRPPHYDVANAIGAAIAQVSGQADVVCSLDRGEEVYAEVEALALAKCIASGADAASVQMHRFPDVHLPYIPGNMARIRRRAVGDLILSLSLPPSLDSSSNIESRVEDEKEGRKIKPEAPKIKPQPWLSSPSLIQPLEEREPLQPISLRVKPVGELTIDPQRGWQLDALDIEYILLGQALHGCGGGGNAYLSRLSILRALQCSDTRLFVVPPEFLADDDLVGSCGSLGSPIVDLEKLGSGSGAMMPTSTSSSSSSSSSSSGSFVDQVKITAMAAFEAGGCNGLSVYLPAAVRGIPIVDADGMGRAFPELPMLLWLIFGAPLSPLSVADELGRRAVFYASELSKMEALARHACVQFGMMVGITLAPIPGSIIKQFSVPHTVSTCWRLGRAIIAAKTARQSIPAAIAAVRGGRLLLEGKVVELQREASGGFNSGRILIEGLNQHQGTSIELEFKNELLVARSMPSREVLASVPDLIALVQTDSGVPVLCEELNFGFRVSVLHLPCHPLWTHQLAFDRVSPQAFGYADTLFQPCPSPYPHQPSIVLFDSISKTFSLNLEIDL